PQQRRLAAAVAAEERGDSSRMCPDRRGLQHRPAREGFRDGIDRQEGVHPTIADATISSAPATEAAKSAPKYVGMPTLPRNTGVITRLPSNVAKIVTTATRAIDAGGTSSMES